MNKVLRFCRNSLLVSGLIFLGTSTLMPAPGLAGDWVNLAKMLTSERPQGKTLEHLKKVYDVFQPYRIVIGASFFCGLLVFFWRKSDGRVEIIALIQLTPIFPEECIAELGILKRRLKKVKMVDWKVQLRLLQECLSLVLVFYVRVKVENLFLPRGDRQIDDD